MLKDLNLSTPPFLLTILLFAILCNFSCFPPYLHLEVPAFRPLLSRLPYTSPAPNSPGLLRPAFGFSRPPMEGKRNAKRKTNQSKRRGDRLKGNGGGKLCISDAFSLVVTLVYFSTRSAATVPIHANLPGHTNYRH